MENLIKALQIFLKYGNVDFPTHCEHDVIYVHGYNIDDFSQEDISKLGDLGFLYNEDDEHFFSYRYGSC